MAFSAEFDSAHACLRLRGDCRMADAATLSSALAALPGRDVTIDLTGAGDWDIGPAWLLYAATKPADAGHGVTLEGQPPRHFEYFDEFEPCAVVPAEPGAELGQVVGMPWSRRGAPDIPSNACLGVRRVYTFVVV